MFLKNSFVRPDSNKSRKKSWTSTSGRDLNKIKLKLSEKKISSSGKFEDKTW